MPRFCRTGVGKDARPGYSLMTVTNGGCKNNFALIPRMQKKPDSARDSWQLWHVGTRLGRERDGSAAQPCGRGGKLNCAGRSRGAHNDQRATVEERECVTLIRAGALAVAVAEAGDDSGTLDCEADLLVSVHLQAAVVIESFHGHEREILAIGGKL